MKTMDKELVDSIEKYEQKREFREVKLQIRQSFREDQDALVTRLSKYRQKKVPTMPSADQNGQYNGGYAGDNDTRGESNGKAADLDGIKVDVNGGNASDTATSESGSVSLHKSVDTDGSFSDRSSTGYMNGCNGESQGCTPNGSVNNDSPRMVSMSHGHRGGQVGSLTPEARPKFGKRLYEKNAKLTASSADHLDKVSVRGVRPSNHMQHHGQRAGENKPLLVPVAQGAEVQSIPASGNLQEFNVEQMVTVFRLLRFPEELIFRLHRNKVNGKRFAMFTDKDLESMGMATNPLVKHFRDRSIATAKKKSRKFML